MQGRFLLNRVEDELKGFIKRRILHKPEKTVSPPAERAEWSIGIYVGESPLRLAPPDSLENPVLTYKDVTDVPAMFVADPFMISVKNTWHMFFEVWNQRTQRGEIGTATSVDGFTWIYRQIVLAEPFHLSYPYVFEWMGEQYMLPETQQAGSINLYKAVEFPTKWSRVRTLMTKPTSEAQLADPSIFRHDERWWLFTRTNLRSEVATLRLYYADDLMGTWHEHPKSPVVKDERPIARPGGRVLPLPKKSGSTIIRYAQDGYPVYGSRLRAYEITELTTATYSEHEAAESPVLMGSGIGWNASGMHHIDAHLLKDGRWIACVDGWKSVRV